MRYLGPDLSKLSISDNKYSSVITQDMKDVTGRESIPNLLAASFATSSWKKLNSALNSIKEYTATIGEGGGGSRMANSMQNFRGIHLLGN